MLIQLTLILWLAQSYVEYKLVKSNAWARRNFHGVRAMAMSVAISVVIGVVCGATMGVAGTTAAAIAAVLGLATNDFTFALFAHCGKIWQGLRSAGREASTWSKSHPKLMEDAALGGKGVVVGIVSFFSAIGKLIRFTGWLCSRPHAINRSYQKRKIDHRLPWEKKVRTS